MSAQPLRDLLLPQAVHIAGRVVDEGGNPIAGAGVDHVSIDALRSYETDKEGKFELDTMAPAFVVRKAGHRSAFVRTRPLADLRITLQILDRIFPVCPATGEYLAIDQYGPSFQFPKTTDLKVKRGGCDIDYNTRIYYLHTGQGEKDIVHGAGPLWSFGPPVNQHVWASVKYEEVVYDVGGLAIIDARGEMPDGSRWRSLGKFGETATYEGMDEATAKILDQFLGSACLKPRSGQ